MEYDDEEEDDDDRDYEDGREDDEGVNSRGLNKRERGGDGEAHDSPSQRPATSKKQFKPSSASAAAAAGLVSMRAQHSSSSSMAPVQKKQPPQPPKKKSDAPGLKKCFAAPGKGIKDGKFVARPVKLAKSTEKPPKLSKAEQRDEKMLTSFGEMAEKSSTAMAASLSKLADVDNDKEAAAKKEVKDAVDIFIRDHAASLGPSEKFKVKKALTNGGQANLFLSLDAEERSEHVKEMIESV